MIIKEPKLGTARGVIAILHVKIYAPHKAVLNFLALNINNSLVILKGTTYQLLNAYQEDHGLAQLPFPLFINDFDRDIEVLNGENANTIPVAVAPALTATTAAAAPAVAAAATTLTNPYVTPATGPNPNPTSTVMVMSHPYRLTSTLASFDHVALRPRVAHDGGGDQPRSPTCRRPRCQNYLRESPTGYG